MMWWHYDNDSKDNIIEIPLRVPSERDLTYVTATNIDTLLAGIGEYLFAIFILHFFL